MVVRSSMLSNGVSALTNSSGPQAESSRDFFYNGLAVFHLGEKDPIATHFLDTGVGQHLNAVASESALYGVNTKSMAREVQIWRKHTSAYLESASS